MFVYNFKVNGSKIFKCFFIIMLIILIVIIGIVTFKIFSGAKNSPQNNTCLPTNKTFTINSNNYTNVLKSVHEDIDAYVGMKIKFTRIYLSYI